MIQTSSFSSPDIIEVTGLIKTYGAIKTVDGVSFSVHTNEIFGILGPNGAGKATTKILERACMCLRRQSAGLRHRCLTKPSTAGVAKTEESASPIANIVTLPQMFLSGIFFSRDVIHGVIKHVTDYLPLTFLADSLRGVAIQGHGITDVWPQLLGLAVWTLIMGFLASRLFRWE